MADLDSILNGSEETETATETETVTTEQETEQPEQETQEEATGAEETQAAAEKEAAPEPDEVKGLRAAAAAERKKRQELEAEREAYRAEVERLRQQVAKPQDAEEPYIDEDVKTYVERSKAEFQQALVQQKLELSEAIAREQHTDFDEKLDTFKDLLKSDPNLYNRMVQQPNPAGWMYKTAAEHQQMQKLKEIGDPVKYEAELTARIREQERAKILAELEAEKKQATEAAIRAKLPKSGFAEERSSGTARATTDRYNGPTPLKSILG